MVTLVVRKDDRWTGAFWGDRSVLYLVLGSGYKAVIQLLKLIEPNS